MFIFFTAAKKIISGGKICMLPWCKINSPNHFHLFVGQVCELALKILYCSDAGCMSIDDHNVL